MGAARVCAEVDVKKLGAMAKAASAQAFCPYSRFRVGAVAVAADGRTFCGCNVENASYGLTICAERNAIFQAVAGGVRKFTTLVIYTPTPEPHTPCGACRQVLCEFSRDAEIVCVCDGPTTLRCRMGELLPRPFAHGQPPAAAAGRTRAVRASSATRRPRP